MRRNSLDGPAYLPTCLPVYLSHAMEAGMSLHAKTTAQTAFAPVLVLALVLAFVLASALHLLLHVDFKYSSTTCTQPPAAPSSCSCSCYPVRPRNLTGPQTIDQTPPRALKISIHRRRLLSPDATPGAALELSLATAVLVAHGGGAAVVYPATSSIQSPLLPI